MSLIKEGHITTANLLHLSYRKMMIFTYQGKKNAIHCERQMSNKKGEEEWKILY